MAAYVQPMSPAKSSKMKQVCSASPGKFAAALMDILDGSIWDTPDPSGKRDTSLLPVSSPVQQNEAAGGEGPVRKRPAAADKRAGEEPRAKKSKVSEEKLKAYDEKLVAERKKQLKAIQIPQLKEMIRAKGLDYGSKGSMIESILAYEAKTRENVRRHQANARDVVVKKREEFSAQTNTKLKELLRAYALHTGGTKPQMVDRLLKTWKEQGEIEKVLAGMAFKARKQELHAMDKATLHDMCCKKGVDALSKDVLVDRLLMHESIEIWQEVVEASRHAE